MRYIHAAVDDHSRLAYCEIHDDETRETAAGFWARAHAWFAAHGITVAARPDRQRRLLPLPPLARHPGRSSASRTYGPGPTGPRPTARSNGSTAPCSTNGPTSGCSPPRPPAEQPCQPGCTGTTTTGPTPHSAATHRSRGAPTCQGRTASRPARRPRARRSVRRTGSRRGTCPRARGAVHASPPKPATSPAAYSSRGSRCRRR